MTHSFSAIVARTDHPNANRRVYPRELLAREIARVAPAMKRGELMGAVDHPGYTGAMASTCIVWRGLELKPDGAVVGSGEIVADHSAGRDLVALIDAGVSLGWSTRGRGSAHHPNAAERRRYGLPDNTDVVVVSDDYELVAVDCVDHPSVADARLRREENACCGELRELTESVARTNPNPNRRITMKRPIVCALIVHGQPVETAQLESVPEVGSELFERYVVTRHAGTYCGQYNGTSAQIHQLECEDREETEARAAADSTAAFVPPAPQPKSERQQRRAAAVAGLIPPRLAAQV